MHAGKRSRETIEAQPPPFNDLFNSLEPPIYLSVVYEYVLEDGARLHGRLLKYGREDNPTVAIVEDKLAQLDSARYALLFSSGMAAITTVTLFLRMRGVKRVLAPLDIYALTTKAVDTLAKLTGIESTHVLPGTEPLLDALGRSRGDCLVFFETVSNTLLRVYDVDAIVEEARRSNCTVVVDNTVASPVALRPHEHGVDITVYSATKHLSGHNDVVAGVVTVNVEEWWEELWQLRKLLGNIASPFTAYLLDRGLRTLTLRFKRQSETAYKLAREVESTGLAKTIYPCLPSHPDYEIAKKLLDTCPTTITLDLGSLEKAKTFLKALRLVRKTTSFGGVETVAVHTTIAGPFSSLPPKTRKTIGLGDGIVRVHIGLEDPDEIITDVLQALKEANKPNNK